MPHLVIFVVSHTALSMASILRKMFCGKCFAENVLQKMFCGKCFAENVKFHCGKFQQENFCGKLLQRKIFAGQFLQKNFCGKISSEKFLEDNY
jgi:ribosomal protein L40E